MSEVFMSGSNIFPSLLLVLFIGLKLTGYVAWSWWWVMSPMWIPLIFVLFIVGFALVKNKGKLKVRRSV
jgi:hypothetical protein